VRNMSNNWKVYRTRFLVRAQQITQPCRFVDALGREHHGCPGDYLVESSHGIRRIAPRQIFEDIYVPMDSAEQVRSPKATAEPAVSTLRRRISTQTGASA
jgi:hypothetical protein